MIRTIIVDDELLSRQRIRQLLEAAPDVEIIAEFEHGFEAVTCLDEKEVDLVFLDIQMPELDGFGVVEAIGTERMPATIFVTAYDQHAIHAFDVNAVDYLLKPFDKDRFHKSLDRVRQRLRNPVSSASAQKMEQLIQDARASGPYLDRLLIRSGQRQALVRIAQIQWIEAEDNYVRLHIEGASHLLRRTMANLLIRLDPKQFRRIHRSAIVNLDAIRELQPWSGGDYAVIMRDGTRLTLSRTYREQFSEFH
jgi:two-component system, LytTR family, response regulator